MLQEFGRWIAGISDIQHLGKVLALVALIGLSQADGLHRGRRLRRLGLAALLLGVASPVSEILAGVLLWLAASDDWLAVIGAALIVLVYLLNRLRPRPPAPQAEEPKAEHIRPWPPLGPKAGPPQPPTRAELIRERLDSEVAQESADKYTRD